MPWLFRAWIFLRSPDSLLKDFCAYIDDHGKKDKHIITANEGNAIALAAGYHLSTGKNGVVYLQNSGIGNIINPLTSIADKEVYRIPMLLIIGWRGEPNIKDEPQHIKQGRITPDQLDLLEIPYQIANHGSDPFELAEWSDEKLAKTSAPVAILIRKGTFANYKSSRGTVKKATLKREEALDKLLELAGNSSIISTTGKTSREVFELRVKRGENQRDFLTVGGMGHTSSIALGVAMGQKNKKVVCIDGDGSALMHLGSLPIIGSIKPKNLIHVLLNNGAHESVGGQPTVADKIDLHAIAMACGYSAYYVAETIEEISSAWKKLSTTQGPVMIEIKITTGSRDDLGRPTSSPLENKQAFMKWLTT